MGLDKTINGFADLSRCCKTGALESTSGENTEPDFCLIEPRGMGGSVVKMNIFVPGQPPIPFRLMGVQIIENDMDLLVRIGCPTSFMKLRNSRRRRRLKCPVWTWPVATSRAANRVVVP